MSEPDPVSHVGTSDELSPEERRRRLREGVVIIAAGLAVLLFGLWEIRRPGAHDTASGNVFSFLLVNLNIVLVLVLVFLVLRNVMKLVVERRRRVPGSQLKSRMVFAFLAIALFPAAVMLAMSIEFSSNSIDDWFSREVEDSLRGAWQVAQQHYEVAADDTTVHAKALAGELAGSWEDEADLTTRANLYRERYGLGGVFVFDPNGREISRSVSLGDPPPVEPNLLVSTLQGRSDVSVAKDGDIDRVRSAVPITTADGSQVLGSVVVDKLIEHGPRTSSEQIIASYREYRNLKLNKRPFQNLYILTMVLASLVVVFSATWVGLYLARGITEPLGRLAEATRDVAGGNWDVVIEEGGGDEVGTLVNSFNAMTSELKARDEQLDERRRYTENILANIDAGVIAVDALYRVATVNPAAVSLLGLQGDDLEGQSAAELFREHGYSEVGQLLDDLGRGIVDSGTQINVDREDEGRTLLVIGTTLVSRLGQSSGFVLFFEDVSQISAVQRMEAWKEVARRIAHEIKNPLTPIQLSAQRMERRLGEKLSGSEKELLSECTETIVNEVDALKGLVNQFSKFARQSDAPKNSHNLNQLVEETLPLYRQSRPSIKFKFDRDDEAPEVEMDREAVKRALVNLLDNAVAAVLQTKGDGDGNGESSTITVKTRYDATLSRVSLEVNDSGIGIPAEHRSRVLEPYFSTKDEGTGLGLAIVSSVAADHRAYLHIQENNPRGTRVIVEFPAAAASV